MFKRVGLFICFAFGAAVSTFAGNAPGIKHFDQVDAHVYRGSQPASEGFHYLASIGVKTIIDLREAGERAKAEERIVRESGMAYLNVPMTGLTPPTQEELLKILPMLESTSGGPVFVHCWRGADRTGAVIAAYQIDHHHWDNARALQDAKAHGMALFQIPRQNFIRKFRPLTFEANKAAEGAAPRTNPGTITPATAE